METVYIPIERPHHSGSLIIELNNKLASEKPRRNSFNTVPPSNQSHSNNNGGPCNKCNCTAFSRNLWREALCRCMHSRESHIDLSTNNSNVHTMPPKVSPPPIPSKPPPQQILPPIRPVPPLPPSPLRRRRPSTAPTVPTSTLESEVKDNLHDTDNNNIAVESEEIPLENKKKHQDSTQSAPSPLPSPSVTHSRFRSIPSPSQSSQSQSPSASTARIVHVASAYPENTLEEGMKILKNLEKTAEAQKELENQLWNSRQDIHQHLQDLNQFFQNAQQSSHHTKDFVNALHQIEELKQELQQERDQTEYYKSKYTSLKSKKEDESNAALIAAAQKAAALESTLLELESNNKSLEKKIQTLESVKRNLEATNGVLDNKVQVLDKNVREKSAECREKDAIIERQLLELDALKQRLTIAEEQKSRFECVLCEDSLIDMIVMPCRHLCMCKTCYSKLPNQLCPICRNNIQSTQQVFLA